MREWQSQSHVWWYCRYHVVIVPKYRRKAIYGVLRKDIGGILKDLCGQFGMDLVEGHAMSDHVHMCVSIPSKLSVAYTIGRLKGKSAVRIHGDFIKRRGIATGYHFCSKGLLREHRWLGRSQDQALHPQSGRDGAPAGRKSST